MNNYELEIEANKLALKIEADDGKLDKAYKQFETEIKKIEKIMPIEAIIPDDNKSQALGLARKEEEGGEVFWNIYSKSVKNKLCDPKGKLNKLANLGISTSAGAIATEIVSILAFPPSALGLAVPIAAILATTGLESYCEWSRKSENDS